MYVKCVFVQLSFIVAFIFGRLCSRIVKFPCYGCHGWLGVKNQLFNYLPNRIEVDSLTVVMESLICLIL